MRWMWLVLALTSWPSFPVAAEPEAAPVNYCHDPDVNAEWSQLAAEHRDSDIWQRLFALRLGLCVMVDRKALTVRRATTIFERQRDEATLALGIRPDLGPTPKAKGGL